MQPLKRWYGLLFYGAKGVGGGGGGGEGCSLVVLRGEIMLICTQYSVSPLMCSKAHCCSCGLSLSGICLLIIHFMF